MKIINNEIYYSLQEVCQIVGKTRATILRWYEYDNTTSQILPKCIELGGNNAKYFKAGDIIQFKRFMENKKKGDMSQISKKYNGTSVNI